MENVSASPSASVAEISRPKALPSSRSRLAGEVICGARLSSGGGGSGGSSPPHPVTIVQAATQAAAIDNLDIEAPSH
ncbi:hypothetical protein BMF35_a1329 [Aurantiacibacter gangjinensis]|nr:hypothetical protein BMF35_a1329 [Aurantiacibacter gangjinensis]